MSSRYIRNLSDNIEETRQRNGTFTTSANFMDIAWCNDKIKQQVKKYFSDLNYKIHDPPSLDTLNKALSDERNSHFNLLKHVNIPLERWFLVEVSTPESSLEKKERLQKEIRSLSAMLSEKTRELSS